MKTEFYDDLIEPKALCENCDYYAPGPKGQLCINSHGPKYAQSILPDDTCKRFWPDSKRWPGCDHD